MTSKQASAGFTMMEILVSLFLIVIILAIAGVSLEAVSDEARLRQPAAEIKAFAKKAVKGAVAEQRSYSVFFHPRFFEMRETYPFIVEQQEEEKRGSLAIFEEEPAQPEPVVILIRHDLADDIEIEVRRWNSKEWLVPENIEWLFDPSGLCEPLSVRFTRRDGYVEIDFNPLTAGVQEERLYIP